jgi:predicted GTPase
MTVKIRTIIMGAAGRDFHNFNVFFRGNSTYQVVAFTAAQIPNIEHRIYPAELAGDLYPEGIQIHPEDELVDLIKRERIDEVVFAYSDVSHEQVMHKASEVLAAGPDFRLMGPSSSSLTSSKPVISVCAARTGSGKSQTSRRIASILKEQGLRVAVVRHPMPYGNLSSQSVQRFAEYEDLDRHECSIEEREEYEPHLANGVIVYAGVDYERILRQAEEEVDVIIWDGGNNDLPFYHSNLHFVVVDPHRAGHELIYHPGEANVRMADVVIVNKVDTSTAQGVERVIANVRSINQDALILRTESPITAEDPEAIKGKRVLVVDDGPTLTHGDMSYGAGWIAATQLGASEIIDPRPFAVGSIAEAYAAYPKLGEVLPAMGYSEVQMRELEQTINSSNAELVIIGTPIDLGRLLSLDIPSQRIRYELKQIEEPTIEEILSEQFAEI